MVPRGWQTEIEVICHLMRFDRSGFITEVGFPVAALNLIRIKICIEE